MSKTRRLRAVGSSGLVRKPSVRDMPHSESRIVQEKLIMVGKPPVNNNLPWWIGTVSGQGTGFLSPSMNPGKTDTRTRYDKRHHASPTRRHPNQQECNDGGKEDEAYELNSDYLPIKAKASGPQATYQQRRNTQAD